MFPSTFAFKGNPTRPDAACRERGQGRPLTADGSPTPQVQRRGEIHRAPVGPAATR